MVRRYDDSDYEFLAEWYKMRDMRPVDREMLPMFGLIYPGVAAGFLVSTDGPYCMIENYIANPDSSKQERLKALKEITAELIVKAHQMGFKKILAFTNQEKAIGVYCDLFKFKRVGHYELYGKEI